MKILLTNGEVKAYDFRLPFIPKEDLNRVAKAVDDAWDLENFLTISAKEIDSNLEFDEKHGFVYTVKNEQAFINMLIQLYVEAIKQYELIEGNPPESFSEETDLALYNLFDSLEKMAITN